MKGKLLWLTGIIAMAGLLAACNTGSVKMPNQELAASVDLNRFMGTWYVHGYTPTFLDRNAYGATETYELNESGKIETTYRFRKGGPDGKLKTMTPTGWVHDEKTNAEWRMRFFGLFTSPYYILYVSPDYGETVIGHPGKEMAWIMTRSSQISDTKYQTLRMELARRDYDLSELTRVEHGE
ncbi:lipocalin family protein [Pelagicoccus sp. SDUM812003]|uniref:lipocalin family protein n=1 Tax=Pelagicoccus sp. SDUM812003 TaxID=3041267 RepID=UPI0028105FD9|nr:lipocalin family protein [Pelagicoccus sp. SDUM812003]MDQ8202482.1 lipocalin family protein [Pelagicoccus sp. SDUM812003]